MRKSFNDYLEDFKQTYTMVNQGALFINRELLKLASDGFIHRIAKTSCPVLIFGASGTGKDFFAKTIHALSSQKDKKMISVNCGGLNEETLLSELFGHVKNAFTGAGQNKEGAIELAKDGTLFLDEIGNLHIKAQVALLRFLNDGTYQKLGEYGKDRKSNARIICATNKDLSHDIKKGNFREDLYNRINVFTIRIPSIAPLNRERAETAFKTFLTVFANKYGYKLKSPLYTEKTFERLLKYDYPGNYREMQNILEYAIVKSNGATIQQKHLPEYIFSSTSTDKKHEFLSLPPAQFFPAVNKLIYEKLSQEHKEREENDRQTAKTFNLTDTRFKRLLNNSREGKAI